MRARIRTTHVTHILALLLGIFAVSALGADAHVGDVTEGVIHSCVAKKGGAVRIVSETKNCKQGEKALDWRSPAAGDRIGGSSVENVTNGDFIGVLIVKVCSSANEADCQGYAGTAPYLAQAGTLSDFSVDTDTSQSGNAAAKFTVRKNGVDTSVTCTILTGASTCDDPTNSVSFAVGDKVSVQMLAPVGYGSPTPTTLRWTARFEPA